MSRGGDRLTPLPALALAVILLVGGLLRLYELGALPIVEDEAYHAVVAMSWAETGSPLPPSGVPYTRGMPVILMDVLSLRLLPLEMETAVRLPSALLGILNVWLTFLLGRRYGGLRVGLAAALVVAVAAFAIYYSRMARMYELLATCTLLAFLAHERLVAAPGWRNLALLVGALCLASTAHALGALLVLLPLAGAVVHLRRPRRVGLLLVAALSMLLFREAYPAFLDRAIPGAAGAEPVEPALAFLLPGWEAQRLAWQAFPWVWPLGSAALVLGVLWWSRSWDRRAMILLGPWVLGVALLGAAGFLTGAALAVAAFLMLSGTWEVSSDSVTSWRQRLVATFAAAAAWWGILAAGIALHGGGAHPGEIGAVLAKALSYPKLYQTQVRPLLLSPHTVGFVAFGAVGMGLVLLRILRHGPLQTRRRALATAGLFLLGVVVLQSLVETHYRGDRYLYLLFPIATAAFLALAGGYLAELGPRARTGLGVVGLGALVLVQLPTTLRELPAADDPFASPRLAAWLPDLGAEELRQGRRWLELDYRGAGKVLREHMGERDLLLADNAHALQTYVPRVDAHLVPALDQYAAGETHYFTGSAMLREPAELPDFLASTEAEGSRRVWVVITGYHESPWTDLVRALLEDEVFWEKDGIAIYAVPAGELAARMGSAPMTPGGDGSRRRGS